MNKEFLLNVEESIAIVRNMKPADFKGDKWIPFDNYVRCKMRILLGSTPDQYLKEIMAYDRFFSDFICTYVPDYVQYM
jgi:hypothetical protein